MGAKSPAPFGEEMHARRDVLRAGAGLASGLVASACSRSDRSGEARAAPGAPPTVWKIQAHIGGETESFRAFKRFCAAVGALSEGRLVFEPHPPGGIVGVFDTFEALKTGILDAVSTSPTYPAAKFPELAFLSSYPLGLDRPDQWETWFYALGGLELARRMHEPHKIRFVGPVQHDLNLIHSRVPIRSFEDFRGKKIRMPGGLIADVFTAAGAKTTLTAGDQIYQALANGSLDAADFVGPAVNFELGFANVAKYIIVGPPGTPCIHQPCDLLCVLVNIDKWNALPKHLQDVVEYAVRRYSWDHYGEIQKANTLSWARYKEKNVEILRISNADVERFRSVAIPIWFKWAKMSPLGREAFASQLAYMTSPAVSYVDDAMLVDSNGKRLTLDG
jgi:TRAP-type mannitol/chloroaromatic compound transport system substrate-binding protein